MKQGRVNYKLLLLTAFLMGLGIVLMVNAQNTGNVSVGATVTNVMIGPAVVPASITPTEAAVTTVGFSFTIEDPQGVSNIDNSSANGTISLGGYNNTGACTADIGVNATAQNYSCTASMQYYDNATTWTIHIEGANLNGTQGSNAIRTFTYGSLNAINMTPTAVENWSAPWVPLAVDISSTDDPLLISQRGNTYSTNIQITAIDLVGGTESIPAANFTMNVADAQGGTALVNATATQITNAYLPSGAPGTENLYLYIEEVPVVTAQTYNSPDNWVATVN